MTENPLTQIYQNKDMHQITVMAKNIIIHKIRTTTPTNPSNDRNRDGDLNTGLEKWYTYVIIVFMHCALNIQVQENQTNLDNCIDMSGNFLL
jgi:hypothetical protein